MYALDTQLAGISMAAHMPPHNLIALAQAERVVQLVHQISYEEHHRHQLDSVRDIITSTEVALFGASSS